MNVALWALQIALAVKFVSVAYPHSLRPDETKMQRGIRFRRVPQPEFELCELVLDDGKKVTSWVCPLAQFFVYALIALGALAMVGQVALMVLR